MTAGPIAVQAVGIVGFALMILATQMPTRQRVLQVDVVGIAVVTAHWLMLGTVVAAAMNGIYVLIGVLALQLDRGRAWRAGYWGLYPLAGGATVLAWAEPYDALALAGTLLSVAARQQRTLRRLRVLTAASGTLWGLYGVIELSIGQMIFSVLFVGGHLIALWRERHD